MTDFLQHIADTLGVGEYFRPYQHHIPRIGRVLVIGGIGALLQTLVFETLGIWLSIVSASTATVIGAVLAILSNFLLNERFSFHDAVDHAVPFYRRILKFYLVSSGSLAIQWVCVFIAEHISTNAIFLNAAFIVGVGIGFLFNYAGYYFFVWRRNEHAHPRDI
jgi:putative flippase GtrA